MKHTLIFAALALAVAATPASAQPVAADLLPAYEVSTIVASMGLRPVGRPAWMRGRYVVAAIDGYGREVNVVLDARDGQVLAVRPLGRGRFGPPPPGYRRPAPYDPMDGRALPPGGPFPDDDEFFDNDRQQSSLPPRAPSRQAAPSRDPSVTGNVARRAPAVRTDAAPKDATPVPRPRPALARANEPGNKPAASVTQPAAATPVDAKPAAAQKPGQAEAKAEVSPDAPKAGAGKTEGAKTEGAKTEGAKSEGAKSEGAKPQGAKQDAARQTKPAPATPAATKPEAARKPQTAEREIRVIDLSKPKDAAKPADKPGEAIRF